MFEDYIIDDIGEKNPINSMLCDVYEKDNDYVIELDVPGYSKENLKVEYNNGYISIIGTKKNLSEENNYKYIRKERVFGVYKRDFYVGKIDYNKVNAKYKDGVLVLIIPKKNSSPSQNIVIK